MDNILDQLVQGTSLSQQQAYDFFTKVMAGEVHEALLGSVLTALKIKGESAQEIAGAALAVRNFATKFPPQSTPLTDCVGTGGDGANTINISTTAAILAAACGIKMAKHGNRSVSSMSGSSDLLASLGVNLTMSPETASECIKQANICFLFAPAYHPGFKYAGPVRAAMGIRTLFNILGPLVNPAFPSVMLLGVYSPTLLNTMAQSVALTGVKRAFVVHGSGLDEIAVHGETQVIEIDDGKLIERTITPEDFGLTRYSLIDIKGGSPAENARYTQDILAGQGLPAHEAAVIINCAALLYLHGKATTLNEAAEIAQKTLKSGQALLTLKKLVEVSNG